MFWLLTIATAGELSCEQVAAVEDEAVLAAMVDAWVAPDVVDCLVERDAPRWMVAWADSNSKAPVVLPTGEPDSLAGHTIGAPMPGDFVGGASQPVMLADVSGDLSIQECGGRIHAIAFRSVRTRRDSAGAKEVSVRNYNALLKKQQALGWTVDSRLPEETGRVSGVVLYKDGNVRVMDLTCEKSALGGAIPTANSPDRCELSVTATSPGDCTSGL